MSPGILARAFFLFTAAAAAALAQSPVISLLEPLTVQAGSGSFVLAVNGSGFVSGSAVIWAASTLATTYGGPNRLSASVPAALIATPGQFGVAVVNPNGVRGNTALMTVLPQALAIATGSLPAAVRTVRYAQTLAAAGGSPPYSWESIDALPLGLSLSADGQLSGTPAVAGTFRFSLRARDAAGVADTKALSLTVNQPPVSIATPGVLPEAVEGADYRMALTADSTAPPLRWSAGAGLPAGVTLSPDGTLQGAPVRRGNYSFRIQVADATNTTATRDFTLTVRPPPLLITTISPLFGGSVGAAYSQPFTATGGTPPYSWSLQKQLPGLALDPQTGSLAGTPREPGSFVLFVTVRDREGVVASGEFPLRIEQPELRITSGSPLPPATAGVHYQQRFIASGGRQPYRWSMGGFVPGLSLDPVSGILSGTPAEAGGFDVFLSIRDDAGSAATRAYRLIVGGGALRLSAIPEPVGTMAGEPLSVTLTASGGTPPYTWAANGLPEGISLTNTGEVTGAVRTPGVYLFTVRLTDAARTSVTQAYRLDAAAPALPDIQIAGAADVASAADQIPLELKIASGYPLPMSGELLLTFVPDTGSGDPAVQFVTGGRAISFQVAAGATEFGMPGPVSLQTGTVAGTIVLSLRLQTPGANLTPVPVTLQRIRIERSAPVIASASVTRTGSAIEIALTGYSTAREITECLFRFRSSGAAPLQSSEVTLAVEEAFGRWFRSAESAAYGGQFTFAQTFAVQGDPALVIPVSVTLTNRTGSTTYQIP